MVQSPNIDWNSSNSLIFSHSDMVATIILLFCRLEALVDNIEIASKSDDRPDAEHAQSPLQVKPILTMVSNVTDV